MKKNRTDWPRFLILLILCIIPIFIFYTILHFTGPQWDISVRALSGQAMVNFFTHHVNLQTAFGGEAYHGSDNLLYYFEPYREPLSTPIFALLYLIFGHQVLSYIILIYLLYLFAIYKLSKELGINNLVAFSLMLNSYLVYFLFLPNGGEGLSIILVFLGLIYLLRKEPRSGLFFGLASLAKYPSIILFPLVLLLGDKKKILKAAALEIAMVLIWGIVDYVIYGIPFYSYFESIGAAGIVSRTAVLSPFALLEVLAYPLLFIGIGAAVILYLRKSKITLKLDYKWKVIIAMIVLSGLCFAIIAPHNDAFTQVRYGYLLATALLLGAALIVEAAVKKRPQLKYIVSVLAIIMLAAALYNAYLATNNTSTYYYDPNNLESIYVHAGATMNSLGFGGCRFISNTWVPMVYSGYDSYSPFVLYVSNDTTYIVNQTLGKLGISTNGKLSGIMHKYLAVNLTYAKEESEYPILVFKYDGVPVSDIPHLNQTSMVYGDANISVFLPVNATCYKN